MMNKKTIVVESVKFGAAVAAGLTLAAVAFPAVKKFLGLDKPVEPDTIPSEDIEEEEISDNE